MAERTSGSETQHRSKSLDSRSPVRLLLLDDEPTNLFLRSIILRQHGYEVVTAATVDEAVMAFPEIDIAVLDYHLGAGQFGTEVAVTLREARPEVPLIILSATLEYHFGGVEDMHLLKGYSSNEDLISALKSLEAKRRGDPVVVDAREFSTRGSRSPSAPMSSFRCSTAMVTGSTATTRPPNILARNGNGSQAAISSRSSPRCFATGAA